MIRQTESGLKYPPLKYNSKKIPQHLIWHTNDKYDMHYFVMFDTKTKPVNYSKMVCCDSSCVLDGKENPSLHIIKLFSNPMGKGLGKRMLKFAENVSKKHGLGGRFHLCASGCLKPEKVPHLFYRKFGMNTVSKQTNEKMDEFIRAGKNATVKDFGKMTMFYPPVAEKPEVFILEDSQKKKSSNITDFLKNIFNILR